MAAISALMAVAGRAVPGLEMLAESVRPAAAEHRWIAALVPLHRGSGAGLRALASAAAQPAAAAAAPRSAAAPSVHVAGTKLDEASGRTQFVISVGGSSTHRYYTDFHRLHKDTKLAATTAFPGKTILRCSGEKLRRRQQLLDGWLSAAVGQVAAGKCQEKDAGMLSTFLSVRPSELVQCP
eukprot:TRINITY_DN2715_c1_g1_i1.p1 TRINITY_DN2715_c1_g1~~TRINITY_DN2715_c1_g1_i1.p1  ORF type:complete len:206 (+),score=82.47 TRINITY_DN2715_c1_g1_i1:76-618(+)